MPESESPERAALKELVARAKGVREFIWFDENYWRGQMEFHAANNRMFSRHELEGALARAEALLGEK